MPTSEQRGHWDCLRARRHPATGGDKPQAVDRRQPSIAQIFINSTRNLSFDALK